MTRWSAVLTCIALGAVAAGAQQPPSFSTRIEAVRVDVLVTRNGRPVRDLQPDDFEVFDNGVAQQVDLAIFEKIPLNVVLAFDTSSSVSGERLEHLRDAGNTLLDALAPMDQASLLTFSQAIIQGARLTGDIARVRDAFARVQATGDTSLVDATFAGMMVGESDVGRSLLIVFSDGLDTSSWLTPEAVLQTAKRSDVVVYAVSAGTIQKTAFLDNVTELTGGRYFQVESTRNLEAIFLTVLEEFRQRYLVSYSPKGVSGDGWHRVEVRVRGSSANVKARPGYLAGDAPQ